MFESKLNKGKSGGYAPLDNQGKLPQEHLLITGFSTSDIFVTGGTYSSGTTVFTNNTGGTFSVTGFTFGSGGKWYAENLVGPTILPTALGFSSIAMGESAQANSNDMFVAGSYAGINVTGQKNNFIGYYAGNGATNVYNSNFIGVNAGYGASGASESNIIGDSAGININSVSQSNLIGSGAGQYTANSLYSNFIGNYAGTNCYNVWRCNFIGSHAGQGVSGASYSTFIGVNAGKSFTNNNVLTNNIIIGTNISLPNNSVDSLNIGGVLFGSGTNTDLTGDPIITPTTNGKIGIGVVTPTARLHVGASTTAAALMKLEVGPAPTSPNDGDV